MAVFFPTRPDRSPELPPMNAIHNWRESPLGEAEKLVPVYHFEGGKVIVYRANGSREKNVCAMQYCDFQNSKGIKVIISEVIGGGSHIYPTVYFPGMGSDSTYWPNYAQIGEWTTVSYTDTYKMRCIAFGSYDDAMAYFMNCNDDVGLLNPDEYADLLERLEEN